MNAKLIKLENGEYDLLIDTNVKSLAGTKLSFKNCQAIERGYDLDELATAYFTQEWAWIKSSTKPYLNETVEQVKKDFISGFQKALELMGDKKFSEEDMFRMFTYGHALTNAIKLKAIEDKPFGDIFNDFIQSLQQTEWDVIVEMEGFVDEEGIYCGERPKLDAENCLILKRL